MLCDRNDLDRWSCGESGKVCLKKLTAKYDQISQCLVYTRSYWCKTKLLKIQVKSLWLAIINTSNASCQIAFVRWDSGSFPGTFIQTIQVIPHHQSLFLFNSHRPISSFCEACSMWTPGSPLNSACLTIQKQHLHHCDDWPWKGSCIFKGGGGFSKLTLCYSPMCHVNESSWVRTVYIENMHQRQINWCELFQCLIL